jgi:hypothetical protein
MARFDRQQIRKRALAIVAENPGGIRWSAILDRIEQETPETPHGTIMGALNNLETIYPSEISKPSRGLYKPMIAGGDDSVVVGDTEQTAPTGAKVRIRVLRTFRGVAKKRPRRGNRCYISRGRQHENKMGHPRCHRRL